MPGAARPFERLGSCLAVNTVSRCRIRAGDGGRIVPRSMCGCARLQGIRGKSFGSRLPELLECECRFTGTPSGSDVGLMDNVRAPQDLTGTTNATGHFSIVVPLGLYDMFFTAPGFTPASTAFRDLSNILASPQGRSAKICAA